MPAPRTKSAVNPLTTGAAFLLIGPILAAIAMPNENAFLLIIGGLLILIGAIELIRGISRIATAIDLLDAERVNRNAQD